MANKPKIATEEQWQDLANKVKSKATFTITDTDPGEGAPLAAGNYIGVYGQTSPFPIGTTDIKNLAVTNAKTNFSGVLNIVGSTGDVGVEAKRTDTDTAVQLLVGAGGANHGIFSMKVNRWILYNNGTNTFLDSTARVFDGWYRAGKSTVTNSTAATVTLPTSNPWGLIVRGAIEATETVSGGWCDLRALDASNNVIRYKRVGNVTTAGSTTVGTTYDNNGYAVATIPLNAAWANSNVIARSVRSASGNYRSWTWQSTGGDPIQVINGGSREVSGGTTAKIQLISNFKCNIHLEVWAKDSA